MTLPSEKRIHELRMAYSRLQKHADAFNVTLTAMHDQLLTLAHEVNERILAFPVALPLVECPTLDQEFVVPEDCIAADILEDL